MPPSFADLGVPSDLVASLARRCITEPFPIQAVSIPDTLAGRGEWTGAWAFRFHPEERHDSEDEKPNEQQRRSDDSRRLNRAELIDRDQCLIGCEQAEGRRRDEQYHRDGHDDGLPERALERFL